MNYYNPYFGAIPYTSMVNTTSNITNSRGLLGGLFSGGKISSFINGTQKTLNIINQAIPIVKQVSPVMKNAKTMFKVMNEFKRINPPIESSKVHTGNTDIKSVSNVESIEDASINVVNNNQPTFFL